MHFIHILNHFEVDFLGSFRRPPAALGPFPRAQTYRCVGPRRKPLKYGVCRYILRISWG